MKLKVWRQLLVQLKEIRRLEDQMKFVIPKSKTLSDAPFIFKVEKVSDTSFSWMTPIFYSFD